MAPTPPTLSPPTTDFEQVYNTLQLLRTASLPLTSAPVNDELIRLYTEAGLLAPAEAGVRITPLTYIWLCLLEQMADLDLTEKQIRAVRDKLYAPVDVSPALASPAVSQQLKREQLPADEAEHLLQLLAQLEKQPELRVQVQVTELERLLCLSFQHKVMYTVRVWKQQRVTIQGKHEEEPSAAWTEPYTELPVTGFLLPILSAELRTLFTLTPAHLSTAEVAVVDAMRQPHLQKIVVRRQRKNGRLSVELVATQTGSADPARQQALLQASLANRYSSLVMNRSHDLRNVSYRFERTQRLIS